MKHCCVSKAVFVLAVTVGEIQAGQGLTVGMPANGCSYNYPEDPPAT